MQFVTTSKLVVGVVILVILLIIHIDPSASYKPVVIIHGMFDRKNSLTPLRNRILQKHPGTNVTMINKLHRWRSMIPLWDQVETFEKAILPIMQANPEGIHLIGYSQGGLIARALIESMDGHNIDTFISLSSPQGGQYGDKFLKIYFPGYVKENAYKLFYRGTGQHISVGNYWRDPHHLSLYYNHSIFLPEIDNQVPTEDSIAFKDNFIKLKKLVLIGGPDDGVISPWQSSQFGCYDTNETVLPMKQRDIYKNDLFGLKTLQGERKIVTRTVPGVKHPDWHKNTEVMDKHVIKFLT